MVVFNCHTILGIGSHLLSFCFPNIVEENIFWFVYLFEVLCRSKDDFCSLYCLLICTYCVHFWTDNINFSKMLAQDVMTSKWSKSAYRYFHLKLFILLIQISYFIYNNFYLMCYILLVLVLHFPKLMLKVNSGNVHQLLLWLPKQRSFAF